MELSPAENDFFYMLAAAWKLRSISHNICGTASQRHSTQILKPISRSRISNPEKESYLFLKCEDEKMSDKPAAPKHTKEAEELAQGKAKNVKVKNIRLRAIYSYDAKMAGTIF